MPATALYVCGEHVYSDNSKNSVFYCTSTKAGYSNSQGRTVLELGLKSASLELPATKFTRADTRIDAKMFLVDGTLDNLLFA